MSFSFVDEDTDYTLGTEKRRMKMMLALMNAVALSLDNKRSYYYKGSAGEPCVAFKYKRGYSRKYTKHTKYKSLHSLINAFSINVLGTRYTPFIEYQGLKWRLLLSCWTKREVYFRLYDTSDPLTPN